MRTLPFNLPKVRGTFARCVAASKTAGLVTGPVAPTPVSSNRESRLLARKTFEWICMMDCYSLLQQPGMTPQKIE
ncbi:hypothetical protein [Paraburkholderia sp. DHOC27]|uniref:hypothetical protein n=1 Tax=Paraburkholderia sp. DHOC27 TaxID=2303330 RepID=UPI0015F32202|nr:hypothetical protein [Paraburkholderia sp. DHOC27]